MKKLIFALAIFILAACTKTDKGNSKQTVVAEDPIKFTTNLDTGIYNASDTVPLNITVSSSMPTAGFLYAITATWTDSSKQIFKLDTSLTQSNLNINIPGLKKEGNYSIDVTLTSKNTLSNTVSKNLTAINSAIRNFTGYKVASNARQLGSDYWLRGTGVMADLIIQTFQNPLNRYQTNF